MLDWTKDLQSRNGWKATKLHEYYDGVKQMAVVSLVRPTHIPGKQVEVIKTYDMRWGKVDGESSMTPADPWDLQETPPPDKTGYLLVSHHHRDEEELHAISYSIKQDTKGLTSVLGQIKVVIDGRTGKVKSATIL